MAGDTIMGRTINLGQINQAGGYLEGLHGAEGIDNLQISTTASGGKRLYANADSVPKAGSITMDSDTGKITVHIPKRWQNDELVKKYTDTYTLDVISSNYRKNKDTQYQDPFDETKKITAEEWIKEMNDALQFQIQALDATPVAKNDLIGRYGGTDAKNNVINGLTTDDVIVMSATFDKDDSWVPIPKYMLLAYPQIEKLSTYTNGWVQKKDFLENLYNIEGGIITEANAQGIARTPEKMLAEVEDMTPEEVAKTVAFGNFIKGVDPKRSNWEQFHQAIQAMGIGWRGGTYDWVVETSDLITGMVSFSWATGNEVDTRGFWNGLIGGLAGRGEPYDVMTGVGEEMEWMAYTNKDALSKAQIGYVQGRLAGQAVEAVAELLAVGEATNAISNFLTSKITGKGAAILGKEMAREAVASSSTALTTADDAINTVYTNMAKNYHAISKAGAGSANYQLFFSQTMGEALDLYSKAVGGMSLALGAMDTAKFVNIVNAASKIATAANFANTAVGVLGSLTIAAVVGNKELTTKVLTNKATSQEAKTWIQQVVWDSAKMTTLSYATGIFGNVFGEAYKGSALDDFVRSIKQKASQKVTGFTGTMSDAWVKFAKWFTNNKAAVDKVSNAKTATAEAIKDAVMANEVRAYGATLSTEPGSYGVKVIEEALRNSGVQPGVTISETLENLGRAGVVIDRASLNLSEYEAWQADEVRFRNALSGRDDIQDNLSRVVHEFTDPNIQPVISQQLSELNNANAAMLKLEQATGLIGKAEIAKNKSILKEDNGDLYAMHSPELARYIVRGYELRIIGNEGRRLGHQNLDEYKPYQEAKARLEKAAEKVSPRLREIADKQYVPALKKVEAKIIDVMVDAGTYPRAFVNAVRSGGKFGKNGEDWMRLVARKDVPKGVYMPYSGTVKRDNTIAINSFKVLDDEDITWPGNGLTELIREHAVESSSKELVEAKKAASGLTTDIVVSGEKTRTAAAMKELKGDFLSAVRQGVKSFVQTTSGTVAIGKKRSAEQLAFLKEVADIGGVETIDIAVLRGVMKEKGVSLAETIVDQESLDKFLETASDEARKILIDAVGEKMDILERDTPYIYADEIAEMERDLSTYKLAKGTVSYSVGVNGDEGSAKYSPVIKGILEKYGFDTNGSGLIAPSAVEDKITGRIEQLKSLGKEKRHITEEDFDEIWKNNSNIEKILRGELEKTSLQTGYGIKDTRARLNAQVPGFDVLDWSLLGREHVDGLVPGGFYHNYGDSFVKAYIIDLKDLRTITGLDKNTEDLSEDAINRITKDINVNGGEAVIPVHFDIVSGDKKFYPQTRWGHSGDRFPDWETYFNYLESLGVTKVPVAIDFSKKTLAHEAILGSFVDKIDKAIATGKKPNVTVEEVAIALREFMDRNRVIKRLRDSAPEEEYSWKDIRKIVEDAEKYNAEVAADLISEKFDDSLISDQAKERLKIQNFFNDVNAKDITSDVQKAFSEYGKIPFFHGQMKPLGSMEYNDSSKVPEYVYGGAGDAYWLAPNASYVDQYGSNKLAGTIPVEYFMSDKEKAKIVQDAKKELRELNKEIVDKTNKIYDESGKWMLSRLNSGDAIAKRVKDLYDSDAITESEQPDVLASELLKNGSASDKKKASEYKSIRNILAYDEYSDEDIDNVASGKFKEKLKKYLKLEKIVYAYSTDNSDYSPKDIGSYRALAEYAGKPVIDISEDGFADGTAFFYYKGIDPKFDEEIGKQLEAQAMAADYQLTPTSSKEFVKWAKNTTVKDVLSLIDYKYESASSDVMKLEQIFEDADKLKGAEKKKFINSKKEDIAKIDESLGRNMAKDAMKWDEDSRITDSFGKIDRDILDWINNNINKPSVYNNSILNRKIFNAGIDSKWLESAMNDAEYSPLQAFEIRDPAVTEEKIAEWNAIDPRNIENAPTEPKFEQPESVSYQDYERGLAEDAGLDDAIYEALRGEQFNKFAELKDNDEASYENLLNKLDRANAEGSYDVKQSEEVQKSAKEYRDNIRDFENAVLFNRKFSYLIRSETAKNTISAFAEENGIELPEGKMSASAKLKSALWQKLLDGEQLPDIKGLKKRDVKAIKDALDAVAGDENVAKAFKKSFYKLLDDTDLFKNAGGPNPLKYELDEETLYNDIDDAIDNMLDRIRMSEKANTAIKEMIAYQEYEMSVPRYEFTVLSQILSKEVMAELEGTIKELARKIVDELVPRKGIVIKGNLDSLRKDVEGAIVKKLESRFATAKTLLESMGETVENTTITELLEKYKSKIEGAESAPDIIKTMDKNGEIQYERVTPSLADIYKERPVYTPMSTPVQMLHNAALLKKINTTDLSLRSFAKQLGSDTAMAFTTVGAIPGTLHILRDELASRAPALLRAMEQKDPIRYGNIKAIAERDGITLEEAFARNSEAIAKSQVPFALLSSELLRQANISKFGNTGVEEMANRKSRIRALNEKINDGLRKASNKLAVLQNKRETYTRLYAGETAYLDALRKGYTLEQAESFREYAINTATTNFRLKHIVFNRLRSTVPYLTSGISGAESFWQMFELDPIGVASRIFTGFIAPILYFAGEIFSDENIKKKYEALSESEKNNHIVMPIGGELVLIPVGEEIGSYVNFITHIAEFIHGENQYEFWNLMLDDVIGLLPGADFTGFTDPEMWGNMTGAPTFLEVMDNGIARMLSGTMPPIVQSMILGFTGRDLYTGKKIDTSRVNIDENGNAVIMSYSTSEFASAIANIIGGDAKVIEKIVSGSMGTLPLRVLDTITSAVQYVSSEGQEGSLMTAVDKAMEDLSAPYTAHGYNSIDRQFNYAVSEFFRKKESIEQDKKYIKYNQEIASEKDAKTRQNLINKRNDLFSEYIKQVAEFVERYRDLGGMLDKWKFSNAVYLITFEDAIRADRQFMDINTDYSDAYKQAMQTLYRMGITNPDGPSSLGYIYTDDDGKPQLRMWTPVQMQIMQNQYYEQGKIHAARINAIIDSGKENSLKKQRKVESDAEQPYWDKYNATGKLSSAEWDAIDDLRKAFNASVVLGLKEYMDTYGAESVLSNDAVIDYLSGVIKVPSAYETVNGRYISSGNGKLDKQSGFAESYIKAIFGVK